MVGHRRSVSRGGSHWEGCDQDILRGPGYVGIRVDGLPRPCLLDLRGPWGVTRIAVVCANSGGESATRKQLKDVQSGTSSVPVVNGDLESGNGARGREEEVLIGDRGIMSEGACVRACCIFARRRIHIG